MSRRAPLVAAAVALGLALGLAALVLRDGTTGSTSPPSLGSTVRVEAAVAPRVSLFGDPVVASVDVLFDRRVVRPESVGIDARFEPWKPQGTPPPAWTESGDLVRLSYRITLTCTAIECLPAGSAQQVQLPSARVHYGLRVQPGRVFDTFTWQPFQVVSRVTEEDVDAARWRADLRALPAVSYRISPGRLGALLLGAAGLLGLAGVLLALRALPPRAREAAEQGAADPPTRLEQALELARETAAANGGSPEARKALERLARELGVAGLPRRADEVRCLAWSTDQPSRAEVEALVGAVRGELGRSE